MSSSRRPEVRGFASAALGRDVEVLLWRPPAAGPAPVVLLLHGADATPREVDGHVGAALAALAADQGVIVAAPDGGDGWWLDAWQAMLADELIPALTDGAPAGACGYSMGGHGALGLALARPGRLRAAGSISGALDLTRAGNRPALRARLGPLDDDRAAWEARSILHRLAAAPVECALRLDCGLADPWLAANRAVHACLDARGLAHGYGEQPGGHDWAYWAAQVPAQVAWIAAALRVAETARAWIPS